jgi:hypothetical protein
MSRRWWRRLLCALHPSHYFLVQSFTIDATPVTSPEIQAAVSMLESELRLSYYHQQFYFLEGTAKQGNMMIHGWSIEDSK